MLFIDEFLLIIPGEFTEEDLEEIAAKINVGITHPFIYKNKDYSITCSIGVARFPLDGKDDSEILRFSDMALYKAKEKGKNCAVIFDENIKISLQLESDLHNLVDELDFGIAEAEEVVELEPVEPPILAIPENESQFYLVFQPQFLSKNQQIRGYEVLSRLNYKTFGQISPGLFIPMLEKNGDIIAYGKWVLRESIRQYLKTITDIKKAPMISVNVSTVQFRSSDFIDFLKETLDETGIPAEKLELEITESVIIYSADMVIEKLTAIHKMGIKIALDDFGTGYSSFNYLRLLPFDLLKIDKSFIDPLPGDKTGLNIVKTIIHMAHGLNMEVIAEGVESKEQFDLLKELGCDFIQGFYNSNNTIPSFNINNDFFEKESKKLHESKESIFSSRLYWAYCKSYMIFFNNKFTKLNTGFISHDNKCSSLLLYSQFFKENNYSLTIEKINNNQILIKKRRKLADSSKVVSIPEKCLQIPDVGYTEESITYNLCLQCNSTKGYYKVLDPNNTLYNNNKGFVQCYNEATKKNFYLDTNDNMYKPCYETCASCDELGDAFNHKCTKCDLRYKFVENADPNKIICEADCPFADYYEKFLGYYQCTRTNSCPESAPYLLDTPELKRCYEDCSETDNYHWSFAGKCYINCSLANAKKDDEVEKTCKDPPITNTQRCFVSNNTINSDSFMTSTGVQSNAQTYAKDFAHTTNHINYYNNSNAIMVIYKDPTCITELNLHVPKIDFSECKEKIIKNLTATYSDFNENTDLIIALVGGNSTSSGVQTIYSFFYKTGEYVTQPIFDFAFGFAENGLARVAVPTVFSRDM